MKKLLLMLSFGCLAAFKFFAVMSENGSVSAALFYTAFFGSPQLIWLFSCGDKSLHKEQLSTPFWVVIAFLLTSLLFGSFPGVERPSWGGEGHFEVPAAFLIEWLVSIVGILVFAAQDKKQKLGSA